MQSWCCCRLFIHAACCHARIHLASKCRTLPQWVLLHLFELCKYFYCLVWRYIFTARRYAKRGICHRHVSICLSVCVCVSVTLRYCTKTAKCRITQITPHDSPVTLVFWHQSSWWNLNGITPYGGDKCRWGGLKFATFDEKCAITGKRHVTVKW